MSEHKSLTELAARKRRRAYEERRDGAHGSVTEIFADTYEREAADLLKLDHPPVVGAGGEVVKPQVVGLPPNQVYALETLNEGATRIAEDASLRRSDLLLQPSFNALPLAIDAADSIQAGNSLEKMLAHQMAVAHEASMRLMNDALTQNDPVEACRLSNAAARLMSAFQDGLLTLQRIRTGGNQTVTVQHVNVAPGGQAVIGNVRAGGAKRRGSRPKNG
jgi:hypothetical protein